MIKRPIARGIAHVLMIPILLVIITQLMSSIMSIFGGAIGNGVFGDFPFLVGLVVLPASVITTPIALIIYYVTRDRKAQ